MPLQYQNMMKQYIYIRQSNGLSYQCEFQPNQIVSAFLTKVVKRQIPKNLKALNKGQLIELQSTFQQNNISANEIIHILELSRQIEPSGYLYLSYDEKVHRIQFKPEQPVRQLKKIVQKQTGLQASQQIILFNSIKLQNSKLLSDYELRTGDFLCMGQLKQIKPIILDIPQVIFPKKNSIQKRRKSCSYQTPANEELSKASACLNPTKGQTNKFVTSNALSYSLMYGPSPLSEYDNQFQMNQFKSSMEEWLKNKPEVIEQRLYLGPGNDKQFEQSLSCSSNKDELCPKQYKVEEYVALCQSYQYNDLISEENQKENTKKEYKIIPKITISRELESKAPNISLRKIEKVEIKNLKSGANRKINCKEREKSNKDMIYSRVVEIVQDLQGNEIGEVEFYYCFEQNRIKINQQQINHIFSTTEFYTSQLLVPDQNENRCTNQNAIMIGYEVKQKINSAIQVQVN